MTLKSPLLFSDFKIKKGVAYFGVRNPRLAIQDLERIAQAGFTHVLHTWSEEDLQYYSETMAELIHMSRQLGLECYVNPWGVGRVFGGEAYTELTSRNPDMAQRGPNQEPLVAACPNHPDFRQYMVKWIQAVCATEVESIFWDEPHFYFEKGKPNLWACLCPTCQTLFKVRYGISMPNQLTAQVLEFREESLIDFLKFSTELVHSLDKRNSVCMLPPWFPAGLEDWDRIAALTSVDEIGSDPYWEKSTPLSEIGPMYSTTCQKLLASAKRHGKEPQIWIKNYHIIQGTEDSVTLATQASIESGIRNIFVWSYMGSEYMSWLKSDHPQKVWALQCKALESLS